MHEAHRAEPAATGRIKIRSSELFGHISTIRNRDVKLGLMIVVERESRMSLGQRKAGMLTMDFFRTPAVWRKSNPNSIN